MTAQERYKSWWNALTKLGDPIRRPHLVQEAFMAGYGAAITEFKEENAAFFKAEEDFNSLHNH